jgi:spermidine synthase
VETPVKLASVRPVQRPAPAVKAALAITGFSAIIGQIVLMRELIVVFNGNEISLGILLAAWLVWTAAGSGASGLIGLGKSHPRRTAAVLECLLALSLAPTIWILRASKSFLQTVPGELVGPLPMLLTSLACLSVFCVVSGALFVVAARMVETECGAPARVAASSAYLLEAAGSAIGGLVASVVLLRFFESFQIAVVVALLNVCMAAVLWMRMSRKQAAVLSVCAALLAIPLCIFLAPSLNWSAQLRLWHGFQLLASRDTVYGNLTVTETGQLRSIYDNGVILANVPDENAAEEAVHYALLEHHAPRTVLQIGGGVDGSVSQALEHPTVERIDYVELDPALIGMARQYFSAQFAGLDTDRRVHIHYADGRRYLKTSDNRFDVIVVDVPDPQTAQLNRFYTAEFFLSAREHLAPGGLLALQLRSSEETIGPDQAEFLRCIQRTLDEVFPYTAVIPGETIHLFGAVQPGVLTEDPQVLMARLRERRLPTRYVSQYFIPYRMMPDRMAQVREQLRPVPSTPVNRDFAPVAYYFDVVLWSTQFTSSSSSWFRAAARVPFLRILNVTVIVLFLAAAMLAVLPGRERRARSAAAFCTVTTGFTLMALEILLLFAFQSIYGYVYHQLAILIGLFMAGIALGSWLGMRRNSGSNGTQRFSMATTQILLALSAPALIFGLGKLAGISALATTWMAAQLVVPALAVLAGMLGGYQFPVASGVYFHIREGRLGLGALYAADLLGGCAGALLVSTYLIPVFGFWKTAWLSAVVNLPPALLALRVGREATKAAA